MREDKKIKQRTKPGGHTKLPFRMKHWGIYCGKGGFQNHYYYRLSFLNQQKTDVGHPLPSSALGKREGWGHSTCPHPIPGLPRGDPGCGEAVAEAGAGAGLPSSCDSDP